MLNVHEHDPIWGVPGDLAHCWLGSPSHYPTSFADGLGFQQQVSDDLLFAYAEFLGGGDPNLDMTNASFQYLELGLIPPDSHISPILADTTTLVELAAAPSLVLTPSSGTPSVTINSPDEGPCHPLPRPTANNFRARNRRRYTRRPTSHGQLSLHEQFDDVMNIVKQLPPGEKPKNTLFTSFFTRECDRYVCLLCPSQTAKVLVNRTQIIQHITGGHGGTRPFECPECPHRAIRKADLQKHTKERHGQTKWFCSKCSKPYSNKRNTRRHEKSCIIST